MFVQLTQPDDQPIFLDSDYIVVLHPAKDGQSTVIVLDLEGGPAYYTVKETMDELDMLLFEVSGKKSARVKKS